VRIYNNAESQKAEILKDNQGKCGVYRLTNIMNKKKNLRRIDGIFFIK